jgi:choline dehydrogenase
LEKTGGNVHALINTFVTRVLPIGNGLDFRGVEFATGDSQGSKKQVVAKKEVILSGGIFGTPQVLLNSGIGPREEVEMIGIKSLVNNPSVGKNFTDQPAVLVVLPTTLPNTE